MKVDFYGKVNIENGKPKIVWDNPLAIATQLIVLDCKRVMITVTDELKEMSNQQRRYYWGHLVSVLADGHGWEREQMHFYLKGKFLAEMVHITHPSGKVTEQRLVPSMKVGGGVTTARIEKFYEDIRIWGAGLGYKLREPNEDELSYDFLDK